MRGSTIIFSIHQPRYSIFKLFDSLCLLGNGYTIYHGPANQALDYFQSIGENEIGQNRKIFIGIPIKIFGWHSLMAMSPTL